MRGTYFAMINSIGTTTQSVLKGDGCECSILIVGGGYKLSGDKSTVPPT